VSQNISTLRKANLVETNQIDKFVYYSTNNFEIQKLIIYSQSISNKETKTDSKELSENYVLLREAYCFLKSILNPGRLSVLEILNRSGELSVNQISAMTQLGQSIVSQHLSNLKTSNLVFSKKLGKQVLYKTNIEKINSLF
jgi:DNA-binding transcriptional ArsR family regulator